MHAAGALQAPQRVTQQSCATRTAHAPQPSPVRPCPAGPRHHQPRPGAPRRPRVAAHYASVSVPAEVADVPSVLQPMPRAVENAADDASLANPLERQQRLSTGWFACICEFEGVVVDSTREAHERAWLAVAQEFDLPRPLGQVLQRIQGARDEVVIMQLFHWTRNPAQAAKLAARKEEIYDKIMNGVQPAEVPGSRNFLDTLRNYNIPVALATSQPERRVRPCLDKLGLANYFDAIVTAEDNGAPEMEFYYIAAASQLQRPFVRCIVVGDSNRSVEAAHELGMKSVIVTGPQPAWNFSGADLVARNLSALSFVNMKKLFGAEDLVESQLEGLEPQPELEADLDVYSRL